MRVDELDFELPRERIALRPAEPRESARLMVLSRSDASRLEHRRVADLPGLLASRDLLVVNDTRVVPARFRGVNLGTGGRVEGLFLRECERGEEGAGLAWVVLLKARRHRPGYRIELESPGAQRAGIVLELVRTGDESRDGAGAWIVRVEGQPDGVGGTIGLLDRVGRPPLPPYILAARREAGLEINRPEDTADYQTSYARAPGSIAAPTAGMHLTRALLERLESAGIERADVTLHVGAGTFKPIETEEVEAHPMHPEWCSMPESARRAVFEPGRRVVAVGSTSARTIESYAAIEGEAPEHLMTRLLIGPGYRWRRVGALLTNFHLPRSTLLAMVASFLEGPNGTDPGGMPGGASPPGIDRLLVAYREAVRGGYRFFSYGDGMLILP